MFSFAETGSILTTTLSVLLCLGAAAVGCYLLYLLFVGFMNAFGGTFERTLFHHHTSRCSQGDELLEKGDFIGAMHIFANAFYLKPIRRESALLSDIANYHTGLLSRLLTIADEMGKGRARLLSLARADRLLSERLELQLAYFRSQKREEADRVRELDRRLRENQTQIRTTIIRLVEEIRSSEEKVLYH